MTPREMVMAATADGLLLKVLADGRIQMGGDADTVNRWDTTVRQFADALRLIHWQPGEDTIINGEVRHEPNKIWR